MSCVGNEAASWAAFFSAESAVKPVYIKVKRKDLKMFYRTTMGLCLAVAVAMTSMNAHAAEEDTGWRKIVDIGCHSTDGDGTCFVTLDGSAFGASLGCQVGPTTQFRFDNANTDTGKRTFAALLAAYVSGKSVGIHLNACTWQGFPAIQWFHISN
jgi:hypothetical protein